MCGVCGVCDMCGVSVCARVCVFVCVMVWSACAWQVMRKVRVRVRLTDALFVSVIAVMGCWCARATAGGWSVDRLCHSSAISRACSCVSAGTEHAVGVDCAKCVCVSGEA